MPTSGKMSNSDGWLDVGVFSKPAMSKKIELYENEERPGAVTIGGTEDSRVHVIHVKEHTLYFLHLVRYDADTEWQSL